VTLPPIDWAQPWYDAVRPAYARSAAHDDDFIAAFNAHAATLDLRNATGQPIRFVPQASLPEGRAYEEFIGATGQVPTRANLHDYFNGLVWQTFPRIKRQLNALQAAQIAVAGVGKSRGAARDGATIFDENAALLVVVDDAQGRQLVEDLYAHRWHAALVHKRALFGPCAQVWLFGHALMEKLVAPRLAMTAHTRVVWADAVFFTLPFDARRAWIDEQVAAALAIETLTTASFTPLQVLGVPGWWPGQDASFYADTTIFRPKRPAKE
jgi:hypothetical protein